MQSPTQYTGLDYQVKVTSDGISFKHPMIQRTSFANGEITGVGIIKYHNGGLTNIAIAYMEDYKKKAIYLFVDEKTEEGRQQVQNLKEFYQNKYVGEGGFMQIAKLLGVDYKGIILKAILIVAGIIVVTLFSLYKWTDVI